MLSKELGVTSKAIVAKCQDESVEGITNHMSTVSAGLAETIREWFSMGAHKTSVETTKPVDLEKVRVKRRTRTRKKKKVDEAEGKDEGGKESAVQVLEAPEVVETAEPVAEESPVDEKQLLPAAEITAPAKAVPQKTTKRGPVKTRKPKTAAERPSKRAVAAKTKPAEAGKKRATKAAKPKVKVERRRPPKIVKPAGPQNVPAPAQMRGPKVIGFAKPDPVVRPVPRPAQKRIVNVEEPGIVELGAPKPRKGAKRRGGLDDAESARSSRHRLNPRRSGRSTLDVGERLKEWKDKDLLERQERIQAASGKGIHARRAKEKEAPAIPGKIAPRKTKAQVNEPVIIHELCAASGIGMSQLWPKFKSEHNMLIQRNTAIPNELAELVMLDFGVELEVVKPKTELERLIEEYEALPRENLSLRPPVVTMLGHVDHGKTSLLDVIRKTSVAEGEAGGITQHTSAYSVERGDLSVTFLDTPGHEAFTAMRARGANMTDVVVLVVAADDGVMPQTIEAINHAKAADVMIVVALNKIDLPGVDTNKVYGRLAELELAPTEWGGHTDVIKTSAVTGEGVEDLITHLATLTELLDLQSDPTIPPMGTVIEAQMKQGIGPLAQVLVREGTLRNGDFIVCGPAAGRVRMMRDDRGHSIKQAGPGVPVELAGLDEVPNAGDSFYRADSLQRAKQIAGETKDKQREEMLVQTHKPQTLQDLLAKRESGELPELNMILRADVQGSVDALMKTLGDIPDEEVKLNILHTGIGSVTESDVVLAEASGALIVGFNVVPDSGVQRLADTRGVTIRLYRVIYDVVDDIRKALEGLLPSDLAEEIRGKATVREIFHISRLGVVAGCMVSEGIISRSHYARVIRDGKIIVPTQDDIQNRYHRSVDSLRRFKEDVREVRAGMECGLRVGKFDDVKPGDVVEAYEVIETARTL
jgi:translation initiation factor IF-2